MADRATRGHRSRKKPGTLPGTLGPVDDSLDSGLGVLHWPPLPDLVCKFLLPGAEESLEAVSLAPLTCYPNRAFLSTVDPAYLGAKANIWYERITNNRQRRNRGSPLARGNEAAAVTPAQTIPDAVATMLVCKIKVFQNA